MVHKDNFVFSHTLKAGVNTILLKILNYHGENGFLLSLRSNIRDSCTLDRNACAKRKMTVTPTEVTLHQL